MSMTHPHAASAALAEAEGRRRKLLPAYLLCVFLGQLGLHRFYLHRNGSALAMLLITVLTLGLGLLVTLPWALVDLFLPGWHSKGGQGVSGRRVGMASCRLRRGRPG